MKEPPLMSTPFDPGPEWIEGEPPSMSTGPTEFVTYSYWLSDVEEAEGAVRTWHRQAVER